jgi:DMSO/TMAO reductase YedYZ molybdopterin-dependent catalytic subunit
MKKILLINLLLATIVAISIMVSVTFLTNDNGKLNPVEVREYQGQNLSSIGDLRENSIKGPQYIDNQTYRLQVTGLVDRNITYTYNDIVYNHKTYQKVVTLYCVEGWNVKILWEGFLVKDLLEEAGIHPNATTVIFYAYDGYSTSLPLNYIINNDIILAYKMNNLVLPPERGFPFQLVAESKWGYKWIKWVIEIEVSDNTQYKGYWESRGYSNNGDLNNSFFGP